MKAGLRARRKPLLRPNRRYKDRLFRFLFREKEDLLALYNALNGSDYDDPESLEIYTMDDVIYMSMKNDIAFLFGNVLNLWEHQGSYNPNMPVRGLFYFARLYQKYVKEHGLDIYSSTLKCLPAPQYVVFYNGTREEPDRVELKLSDAFYPGLQGSGELGREPCLEVRAVMLNINLGKNRVLMEHCRRLKEYAEFVDRVRRYLAEDYRLPEAVDLAVESCIRDGILADVLSLYKREVVEMFLTEYNERDYLKLTRKEGYREGKADGKAEGKAECICILLGEVCDLPEEYKRRIMSEERMETLDLWLKAARRAESLEEFLKETHLELEP